MRLEGVSRAHGPKLRSRGQEKHGADTNYEPIYGNTLQSVFQNMDANIKIAVFKQDSFFKSRRFVFEINRKTL